MRAIEWLQAFVLVGAWMMTGALLDAGMASASNTPDDCATCAQQEETK